MEIARRILLRLSAEDAAKLEEIRQAEEAKEHSEAQPDDTLPVVDTTSVLRKMIRRMHRWHVEQKEKGRHGK